MTLSYLDFDYSEDAQGSGSFDAMASALPAQLPALQAEVARVLDWAHRDFAGVRGPLDEGGDWDYELQGVQEASTTLQVRYDLEAGQIQTQRGNAESLRATLSLTISGTPAFCQAFRDAFELA
ncbi:MAG TPA: hypothetical protein VLJ57_18765 [Burkholderiaceae bacterium]|nr:hypothetical protein [Burkholderiaceae bacterium]